MFDKAKDLALSKGAQMAINNKISDYGKVTNLSLNSKNNSIKLEVMLEGEAEPLYVNVDNYELKNNSGEYEMILTGITTSRMWLNKLSSQYLDGKGFEIPAKYAQMLEKIV